MSICVKYHIAILLPIAIAHLFFHYPIHRTILFPRNIHDEKRNSICTLKMFILTKKYQGRRKFAECSNSLVYRFRIRRLLLAVCQIVRKFTWRKNNQELFRHWHSCGIDRYTIPYDDWIPINWDSLLGLFLGILQLIFNKFCFILLLLFYHILRLILSHSYLSLSHFGIDRDPIPYSDWIPIKVWDSINTFWDCFKAFCN